MRVVLSFIISFFICLSVKAQQPVAEPQAGIKDSSKTILIRKADRLGFDNRDSSNLTYAAGAVEVIQGTTTITCDSAIYNRKLNTIEAFGDVHINDADSVHTYSKYVKYFGSTKKAVLKHNVKLTDTKGLMMTDELEYDLAGRIATYKNGATIYNGSTVLKSQEGYYYTNTKDIYFKKNVSLVDPKYTIATDTLLYNTQSQVATFVVPTTINDGKNIVKTSKGFYNLKDGSAYFGERTKIEDANNPDIYTVADEMIRDPKSGQVQFRGNFIRRDSSFTMMSGEALINDSTQKYLFTRHPVLIIQQEKDSIYITADTIYVGRLADKKGTDSVAIKDTINKTTVINTKKDSTDASRYFEAFRHVRVYSDSLQAAGDSLYYSLRDSIIKLFKGPVVWANKSQITGDTIFMFTKNKQPDQLYVFENSYVISKVDSNYYNQIKSTRLFGYFRDGEIDYIRAKGNAESIYFIQNEDSAFLSVNKSQGDVIDMYFAQKELKKVVFRSEVKGTSFPMKDAQDENIFFRNFKWQEKRRPKSKAEIFGEIME